MKTSISQIPALVLAASTAAADAPVIENIALSDGRFSVTLSHPDTGWDHYADGWRVELADGTVLGTRELAHPHVNEQPFTRSATITMPEGVREVFVRTSCNVDGWADAVSVFEMP
ncbi:MAG: hypothetical protein KJP02_06640 [Octadecabacter sp.]|nr:hypothetical protein [Octadecabacter sp.]